MLTPSFNPCAIVPVFDHEHAVARVVAGVRAAGLPCVLVDDGSGPACARELDRLAATVPHTSVLRLPVNGGKGAAMLAGFAAAWQRGYSHGLQIDADGQHSLEDIPDFLAQARREPGTLICGRPVFDRSMPALRHYGRYLTHVLVWLNTLSRAIPDSMCGFRVYPLEPVMALMAEEYIGRRMDFDVEIIVRMYWRDVPMRWLPTRVTYPADGVSHFRLIRDNGRMIALQLRLFCGMLRRLPRLLGRRAPLNRPQTLPTEAQAAWAARRERGALFMMWLMFHGVKLLSRPLAMPFVYLSTAYFFLVSHRARAASRDYLARVAAAAPDCGVDARPMCVYRHFLSFARAIVDKQNAWLGRIDYSQVGIEDHARMRVMAQGTRGVLLIGSHLGNLELCRALATLNRRVRLNVLVHTRHSRSFNQVLRMAGATQVELIQVTELSVATALMLKTRIDQGEWVVISGDRVPVHGGRTVDVRLLGAAAPMPVGPYVLASVLECPVHLLFCLRRPSGYRVYFEPFCTQVRWQRSQRDAIIADLAQRFAARLEHYLLMEPLQWFNFYPFWRSESPARQPREPA